MLTLENLPLSVFNRALELYGADRELTIPSAMDALMEAYNTKDVRPDFPGISPLAQSVAEYMSLSGPWAENDGEYAGEGGYQFRMSAN